MTNRKFATLASVTLVPAGIYFFNNSSQKVASRTGRDVEDSCRILHLPTPSEAQSINICHAHALLTSEEVSRILTKSSLARSRGTVGYVERKGESGRAKLNGDWRTTYLHSGGFFSSMMDTGELMKRILQRVDERAKDDDGWKTMQSYLKKRVSGGNLNFRTIELHEYGKGGGLPEQKHYDAGSILTIDVMMCEGDRSFDGGQLYCPIYDDDDDDDDGKIIRRDFVKSTDGFNSPGEAIIFPSHKFHNVSPIKRGKRVVMVLEIWDGEEKVRRRVRVRVFTFAAFDKRKERLCLHAAAGHKGRKGLTIRIGLRLIRILSWISQFPIADLALI